MALEEDNEAPRAYRTRGFIVWIWWSTELVNNVDTIQYSP